MKVQAVWVRSSFSRYLSYVNIISGAEKLMFYILLNSIFFLVEDAKGILYYWLEFQFLLNRNMILEV